MARETIPADPFLPLPLPHIFRHFSASSLDTVIQLLLATHFDVGVFEIQTFFAGHVAKLLTMMMMIVVLHYVRLLVSVSTTMCTVYLWLGVHSLVRLTIAIRCDTLSANHTWYRSLTNTLQFPQYKSVTQLGSHSSNSSCSFSISSSWFGMGNRVPRLTGLLKATDFDYRTVGTVSFVLLDDDVNESVSHAGQVVF